MGQRLRETERKYEAAADDTATPPDLDALPGVAGVRTPEPDHLDAVYYDTADLALGAHRITLRRRTGEQDAGWHLKLPTAQADTRTEVRVPLGTSTGKPPKELRTEVSAVVRGRRLAPAVRLRTTRQRTLLLDEAGRTLAEIAYDEVRADLRAGAGAEFVAGSGPDSEQARGRSWVPGVAWTETEVELYEGAPELLDAVEERLLAAGLHRSGSGSKLAYALGDRLVPLPRPPAEPSTAGQTATAYLYAQLTAILALDPAVRRAEEDAVHRMRVATRRARSALKSFRRELDRKVTDPLGDELKWLAAALGMERDREVLAERLARRLGELNPGLVSEASRRRLALEPVDSSTAEPVAEPVTEPVAEPVAAGPSMEAAPVTVLPRPDPHAALVRELDGPRYFALLDALEALLTAPPYRLPAADDPARQAAAATVRRDHDRLRTAVESALAMPPGAERDTALHEARKDAKRARYSSEAAEPVLAARATAHTARMKAMQQLLGEHQDSFMCRAAVATLRRQAVAAGEDPAPYDAIDIRERALAAEIEAVLPAVWQQANRPV